MLKIISLTSTTDTKLSGSFVYCNTINIYCKARGKTKTLILTFSLKDQKKTATEEQLQLYKFK